MGVDDSRMKCWRLPWAGLLVLALWWLAGCAARSPAWVEDRSLRAPASQSKPARRAVQKRPRFHRVRKGDTLYGIAFRHGLRFQDLARWNGIRKPYVIHPGQRLRLHPPPRKARPVKSSPSPARRATVRTQRPKTAVNTTRQGGAGKVEARGSSPRWQWPVKGRLLSGFKAGDPARQGINIAVAAGTPVRAAAAGRVVYSGSALRGYGELVIVKHDETWLTAYGHNSRRRVKEGQAVQAGQVIAISGDTEAPRPMLHFEIRRNGKPVDPLRLLP